MEETSVNMLAKTVRNPDGHLSALRLVPPAPIPEQVVADRGRNHGYLTPAKLQAFIAVAEEGALSAAARRLHLSQPALSQTINALERQFGVKLFVRSNTGMQTTPVGRALVRESRAFLASHDQLLRSAAQYRAEGGGVVRLGVPLELDRELLRVIASYAEHHPETRVEPTYLRMAEQLAALRSGELDVSFMRERPAGAAFDTMLVAREPLGVLLAEGLASQLATQDGVPLDELAGLDWIGFPRSDSPAWYDELTAGLRTHGIDTATADSGELSSIPSVMLAAVASRSAFALVPSQWAHPVPQTVVWNPLAGDPIVRRTWAVWPASSRRHDVAHLVAALGQADSA